MIFVTASATAILEAAAEFIMAHGVLSPIDIASPVEEKKLEELQNYLQPEPAKGQPFDPLILNPLLTYHQW